MEKILIVAIAILLGFSTYKLLNDPIRIRDGEINLIFEKWSLLYKKNYNSFEEKNYRFNVFRKNYLRVEEINKRNFHWRAGLNKFSDMSEQEVEIKYFGYKRPVKAFQPMKDNSLQALPKSIDWREKGKINPIKNQGSCGSCWAFSAIAAIESNTAIKFDRLLTLSEQQLVDCSGSFGNNGCNGGLMDNAFKYMEKFGITSELQYPYKAEDGKCNESQVIAAASVLSYHDIPSMDNDSLKASVARQVVSVAIHANQIIHYKSGVFHSYCGTQLNHGVAVVGYGNDEKSGLDFWIVRNSWGEDWGNNGYILIERVSGKHTGKCGIALAASYPIPREID